MTQEERSKIIESLNKAFIFIEDLADAEAERLKLFIQARGFKDEDEPLILKAEQRTQELRQHAENILDVINLLIDEEGW